MRLSSADQEHIAQMMAAEAAVIEQLQAELVMRQANLATLARVLAPTDIDVAPGAPETPVDISGEEEEEEEIIVPASPLRQRVAHDTSWERLGRLMTPAEADLPTYDSLFNSVLVALEARPELTASEMYDRVVESLRIPRNVQQIREAGDGGFAVRRRLAWARNYMSREGFIEYDRSRKLWLLKPAGAMVVHRGGLDAAEIHRIATAY